jgi:hypothetical protein
LPAQAAFTCISAEGSELKEKPCALVAAQLRGDAGAPEANGHPRI